MVQINNLQNNQNLIKVAELGCFEVYEHQKDLSINPQFASVAYFMHEMNYRKRQVCITLNGNSVKMQAGAMQWMAGNVTMNSGVKGVGDFLGKKLKGMATGESTAKPVYQGVGQVMLEPTYRYIILEDVSKWDGGMVLDDGLFLACDSSVNESVVARNNISSAVLGGEGLFNLCLSGHGVVALESAVPKEELIEVVLDNEELKVDGNMAIAWSKSLSFTVEKSSKSVLGSLVSGEGLVNVYRGKGRVLLAPTTFGTTMSQKNSTNEPAKTNSAGILGGVVGSMLDL